MPRGDVMKIAAETGALPYDVPDVELGLRIRCSIPVLPIERMPGVVTG